MNNIFKKMPIQDILKFAKIGYTCYPIIQQKTSFEKKEVTNDTNNTKNTNHNTITTQG